MPHDPESRGKYKFVQKVIEGGQQHISLFIGFWQPGPAISLTGQIKVKDTAEIRLFKKTSRCFFRRTTVAIVQGRSAPKVAFYPGILLPGDWPTIALKETVA